ASGARPPGTRCGVPGDGRCGCRSRWSDVADCRTRILRDGSERAARRRRPHNRAGGPVKTRRTAARRLDDAIREGCGLRKSVDEGQAFPFTSVSFRSAAIYRSQDKLQVIAQWLKVEPQALRFGDQAVSAIR